MRIIDDNHDAIREELLPLLPRVEDFPKYHEADARQVEISAGGPWRVFFPLRHPSLMPRTNT